MANEEQILRDQLKGLIRGGSAHLTIADALADFPASQRGVQPAGAPHNAWQLLEHIRFTLHDLLEFSTNSHYAAPKWPDDYWPTDQTPPATEAWDESVAGLTAELEELEKLVDNPKQISIPPFRGATVKTSCARSYWPRTIPATT
jgi:hypothetical protein